MIACTHDRSVIARFGPNSNSLIATFIVGFKCTLSFAERIGWCRMQWDCIVPSAGRDKCVTPLRVPYEWHGRSLEPTEARQNKKYGCHICIFLNSRVKHSAQIRCFHANEMHLPFFTLHPPHCSPTPFGVTIHCFYLYSIHDDGDAHSRAGILSAIANDEETWSGSFSYRWNVIAIILCTSRDHINASFLKKCRHILSWLLVVCSFLIVSLFTSFNRRTVAEKVLWLIRESLISHEFAFMKISA